MSKARVFLFLNLAFLSGVALKSFVLGPALFVAGFFLFLWSLWFLALRKEGRNQWNYQKILFMAGMIGAGALGALRLATFQQEHLYSLSDFQGKKVEVRGTVSEPPEFFPQTQRLKVGVVSIKEDGRERKVGGEVLVSLRHYPSYDYGELLMIQGELDPVVRGGQFAGWVIGHPEATLMREGETTLRGLLFYFREKFGQGLNQALREPYAALARGLLLGEDAGFGSDVKDAFRASGLSHIIALSGYNITIVAGSLIKFLRVFQLPPGVIFSFASGGIILFTLMTGAQASTVRAAIMGLLVLMAEREGRIFKMANALAFAGSLMVFFDPTVLRFNTGFQLSFLSTIGLVYLAPKLLGYFLWLTNAYKLREIVVATLSSQMMVLPLLLGYFGNFSLLGILANILVLPLIPLAMLLAFVSGGAAVVVLPAGEAIGWVARLPLGWIVKVAETFASLSFAILHVSLDSSFTFAFGAVYYAILLFFLIRKKKVITANHAEKS